MKAAEYRAYGAPDVIKVVEVQKPVPGNNEIAVKIHAASVTRADTMMRRGTPYLGRLMLGLCRPKYRFPGTGFAGVVESVGKDVTRFQVGERVFGESIFGSGANAEYVCVPEDGVVLTMPEKLSFAQACNVCDGPLTSLNFLRDVGQIQSGQQVLIIGASGSLGSAAVQLAHHFGAEVTAVCSGTNAAWVTSLGAERVIDYTRQTFTEEPQRYDLIFDTVGQYAYCQCRPSLKENGIYLTPVFSVANLWAMALSRFGDGRRARFSATGMRPTEELRDMLGELKTLFSDNKLHCFIDREYSLTEVADAHAYIDTGRKKGSVVLMLAAS